MKNLVRGGVILSLIGMFVVFIYAQTKTEGGLINASQSQQKLNNNNLEVSDLEADKAVVETSEQDKNKLVSKTGSTKAVGANKGSFVATAYCLRGRTAMGHPVRSGLIAADPRVLKLGSRVQLSGIAAGNYLVSDTGGDIKGKRIDIWMASCADARRFGRRSVNVTLLGR